MVTANVSRVHVVRLRACVYNTRELRGIVLVLSLPNYTTSPNSRPITVALIDAMLFVSCDSPELLLLFLASGEFLCHPCNKTRVCHLSWAAAKCLFICLQSPVALQRTQRTWILQIFARVSIAGSQLPLAQNFENRTGTISRQRLIILSAMLCVYRTAGVIPRNTVLHCIAHGSL